MHQDTKLRYGQSLQKRRYYSDSFNIWIINILIINLKKMIEKFAFKEKLHYFCGINNRRIERTKIIESN